MVLNLFAMTLTPALAENLDDNYLDDNNEVEAPEWRYRFKSMYSGYSEYIVKYFDFAYSFDDYFYYVDGNSICRMDIDNLRNDIVVASEPTARPNIIYTDEGPGVISHFVAAPEMAFYVKDDTLYRLDLNSGKSCYAGILKEVAHIKPITYDEIIWTRYGPCTLTPNHGYHEGHDEDSQSFYLNIKTGEEIPLEEYYARDSGKAEGNEARVERIFEGDIYLEDPSEGAPTFDTGIAPYSSPSFYGVYHSGIGLFLSATTWYSDVQRNYTCHNNGVCTNNTSPYTCWHAAAGGILRSQCYAFAFDVYKTLFANYDFGAQSAPSNFFYNSNNDVIIVYEENINGDCEVGFRQRTFAQLASAYTQTHWYTYVNYGAGNRNRYTRKGCSYIGAHYLGPNPNYCGGCGAFGQW